MQHLHVVGFTTDHSGLILSVRRGSRSGSYLLVVDDHLLDLIDDLMGPEEPPPPAEGIETDEGDGDEEPPPRDQPRRRPSAARPKRHSALTPREMQARLRAGQSVAEVASTAGVDEEWVGRFAAPIIAEQMQVVARAAGMALRHQRFGESALPLGQAVRGRLADKGVVLPGLAFDEAWSARHLDAARWLVRFRYVHRGRLHSAQWEVDTAAGTVSSANRLATELGFVGGTGGAAAKARRPLKKAKKAAAKKAPPRREPAKRAPAKRSPRPVKVARAVKGDESPALSRNGKAPASTPRGRSRQA